MEYQCTCRVKKPVSFCTFFKNWSKMVDMSNHKLVGGMLERDMSRLAAIYDNS